MFLADSQHADGSSDVAHRGTQQAFLCMLQGMLLVGFSKEHGNAASGWLQQMEPGFLVSYCTADILAGTVQQAVMKGCDILQFRQEEHEPMDEVLPRLVLLSGMSGEEAIAIAEHWEHFTGIRALLQIVWHIPWLSDA